MFEHAQVQSYNQIKAPAELKQRVFDACAKQETSSGFSRQKTTLRLAPLAACLLLLIGTWFLNNEDTLLIQVQDTPVTSEYRMLPAPESVGTNSMIRTISLEPATYTTALSLNRSVKILSVQGEINMTEDGTLLWTVNIPCEDTIFELFLHSEDGTYYIPLQYHVNENSFSIRCEKQ